jgi:hypothetical protein
VIWNTVQCDFAIIVPRFPLVRSAERGFLKSLAGLISSGRERCITRIPAAMPPMGAGEKIAFGIFFIDNAAKLHQYLGCKQIDALCIALLE